MICSTNAIESLNARYRRAIKARGHFPSEQAALKCLYLVTRSLDPTAAPAGHDGRCGGTSAQRVRDHLRRPIPRSRDLLIENAGNPVSEKVPPRISQRGLGDHCQGSYSAPLHTMFAVPVRIPDGRDC